MNQLLSKNKVLFVIYFTFFSSTAFSQSDFRPGFYITWENDTVYGLIDYRGEIRNARLCVFKTNENAETVKFVPEQIKAYKFSESKFYLSEKIPLDEGIEQVFLEFLVDGITNLFYYQDNKNSKYFLEDRTGKLFELADDKNMEYIPGKGNVVRHSYQYIGLLKAAFADCMPIQSKVDKVKLGHKSLINITKDYHDYVCDSEECIVYKKELRKLNPRFAPIAGVSAATLSFDRGLFSKFTFEQSAGYFLGFLVNTNVPRLNEKLSFEAEINIRKNNYYGSYSYQTEITNTYYHAQFNLISFQPSIAVKYKFPKGKVKPTLALGIFSNHIISKSQQILLDYIYSERIDTYEMDYKPITNSLIGSFFAVGCNYEINSKHEYFASLKYDYSTSAKNIDSTAKLDNLKTQISSFDLSTGIYF